MKRSLNTHISEAEHAWLKTLAKRDGIAVVRQMIRDSMQRELAREAIASGLRCSWEGCQNLPEHDAGDRPDLCRAHQDAAAARLEQTRKSRRAR